MPMNCVQPNHVGADVTIEYNISCGNIDPTTLDYAPIGSLRGKEFNSEADTVDTTSDSSAGQVRSTLITYKSGELSIDGVSTLDDGTTQNQTALYMHFWNERQPTAWFRITYPDITIYAYMVISSFNRSSPYDEVGTFDMTASVTATGVASIQPVTIEPTPVPVVSVTVSPGTATIDVGNTTNLVASVVPMLANQSVTWSSATPATATVSATGVVTGVAIGTVTITATSVADPTKTDTCVVEVAV